MLLLLNPHWHRHPLPLLLIVDVNHVLMKYGIPLLPILQAASVVEAASLGYKLIEDTMKGTLVSELLMNFPTDHAALYEPVCDPNKCNNIIPSPVSYI